MQKEHFQNYTTAEGLSSNQALTVHQDHTGAIWVETQGGIDRLMGEHFVPFPSAQSRYGPFSIRFAEDSLGDLYTTDSPKGISLIESGRLITFNENLKALDMVESSRRNLWFSGIDGIIRVALNNLKRSVTDRDAPLDYTRFDRADGMNSLQCSVGAPNIAITPDDKLWVATVKGLAMIDLARLQRATRVPEVFVGAVTIGKNKSLAGRELILAPGTHHVELHLEAVDLASPEKIRLQYRMDGVDAAWLDADASRTAIYTSIPVGTHAFHVRASASDGVWDRVGIVYNVTQRPFFYQTTWFLLAASAIFVVLLFAIYLVRVRHIIREANILVEERLVERERIARELHDTLLQGILSASMQLDVAEDQLPADSPAKPLVGRVLQMMRQVVEEGRSALQGLRTQETDSGDLEMAFSRMEQEFAMNEKFEYRVISRGVTRPLRPLIRDEVYRICREALVNAFLHADAKAVEVEIEYASKYLRILVRDDGCGIDPQVMDAGREGHWGLPGMRERSESVGASLRLRSRIGAGTEVELTVPGSIAFEGQTDGAVSRWFVWLNREKFESSHRADRK
jgi:signal transduction histidine kinase